MSRTPNRLVPRLEWLEDRSVPSTSPVNARLALAPLDRPEKVEAVETIQRLHEAADSRPALQAALTQLNAAETATLVNAVASADTVNVKQIRDALEDIRAGELIDELGPDTQGERNSPQLPVAEGVATEPTPLLAFLTADLRADLTAPTSNLPAVAPPTDTLPSRGEPSGGEVNYSTLILPPEDAAPKTVAVVRAVSPGVALQAELIADAEPAGSATTAGDPDIVAAPAPELMAARLTTDGSGLEAFVASLDRFGQVLGLPEGASFPSWVVATALALATCEVARRQARAARRTRTLTPADDLDTLTWSWTTL